MYRKIVSGRLLNFESLSSQEVIFSKILTIFWNFNILLGNALENHNELSQISMFLSNKYPYNVKIA